MGIPSVAEIYGYFDSTFVWWVFILMSVDALLALIARLTGRDLPRRFFVRFAMIAIFFAVFMAWREERNLRLAAESSSRTAHATRKRQIPQTTIELAKGRLSDLPFYGVAIYHCGIDECMRLADEFAALFAFLGWPPGTSQKAEFTLENDGIEWRLPTDGSVVIRGQKLIGYRLQALLQPALQIIVREDFEGIQPPGIPLIILIGPPSD